MGHLNNILHYFATSPSDHFPPPPSNVAYYLNCLSCTVAAATKLVIKVRFTDFDKLNLVKFGYGGLLFDSSRMCDVIFNISERCIQLNCSHFVEHWWRLQGEHGDRRSRQQSIPHQPQQSKEQSVHSQSGQGFQFDCSPQVVTKFVVWAFFIWRHWITLGCNEFYGLKARCLL